MLCLLAYYPIRLDYENFQRLFHCCIMLLWSWEIRSILLTTSFLKLLTWNASNNLNPGFGVSVLYMPYSHAVPHPFIFQALAKSDIDSPPTTIPPIYKLYLKPLIGCYHNSQYQMEHGCPMQLTWVNVINSH